MKKNIAAFFLTIFLLHSLAVHANPCMDNPCIDECGYFRPYHPSHALAVKCAAFYPLSSEIRHAYGSVLTDLTLEANWKVISGFGDLYVWLDGSYIFGTGHTHKKKHKHHKHHKHHHSDISIVPITCGLKYVYRIEAISDLYFGLGPSYSFVNFQEVSPHHSQGTSNSSLGMILKFGFLHHVSPGFYFEEFCNYYYQKFHKNHHELDFSSLQFGAAIAWSF